MGAGGIHLSPVYSGIIEPISLSNDYGDINIYMLPFVKPGHVRRYHEEKKIRSYTEAIRCAINDMNVDTGKHNILTTQQFVTGVSRSEPEETFEGGADNLDAYVLESFDYVALGNIHSPQNCGFAKTRTA